MQSNDKIILNKKMSGIGAKTDSHYVSTELKTFMVVIHWIWLHAMFEAIPLNSDLMLQIEMNKVKLSAFLNVVHQN